MFAVPALPVPAPGVGVGNRVWVLAVVLVPCAATLLAAVAASASSARASSARASSASASVSSASRCVTRQYGHGSVVCVCNARQCGALEGRGGREGEGARERPRPSRGTFSLYTSSKAGMRLHLSTGNFTNGYSYSSKGSGTGADSDGYGGGGEGERFVWSQAQAQGLGLIAVDPRTTYQTIHGFGGAVTDSAAINAAALSPGTRDMLMRALFGPEGNAYTLLRVPMGGTDDSVRKYTYADVPGDTTLQHFQLAEEDIVYKIPFLRNASALASAGAGLRLIGSAWTAPPWMKTNHKFISGMLRRECYQAWAEYHVHFLDEYARRGAPLWAITSGNEPINGFLPFMVRFNSMGWTPLGQRHWLGRYLGPTLRRSPHNATLLLALDDQRMLLPWWMDILFRDSAVKRYVDGVAVHWYWDIVDPSVGLDFTNQHYPDKFIISSEASSADKPWQLEKVQLGSWERAEKYMQDIILVSGEETDMNHWVTGWMEWSLVLDTRGGPTWSGNYVDVGVIADPGADEFLLQPTYYAMAHFSRFVPPGSRRLRVQQRPGRAPESQQGLGGLPGSSAVSAVAFRTPDDQVAVVMHNSGDSDAAVTVLDPRFGEAAVVLPARSFSTLLYAESESEGEGEGEPATQAPAEADNQTPSGDGNGGEGER